MINGKDDIKFEQDHPKEATDLAEAAAQIYASLEVIFRSCLSCGAATNPVNAAETATLMAIDAAMSFRAMVVKMDKERKENLS